MEQARVAEKPKVVFVLGATATGKSKLAIALAKRFDGEVINADKIQVHDGAPIITNKVTDDEMAGVRHHLLSVLPPDAEFTAEDFRREAGSAVARVLSAGRLPVVAGGSNNYIEALVEGNGAAFRDAHDVLFLWVDTAPELLKWYTALRVDEMVVRGLVDEARATFDLSTGSEADYTRGVRRAIGLPEMHAYLLAEREGAAGEAELAEMLARAVRETKDNTFDLVRTQVEKIHRLSKLDGWDVRRIDATPVFARMAEGDACDKQTWKTTWKTLVWEPCEEMVKRFLETPTAPPVIIAAGNAVTGEPSALAAVTGVDGESTALADAVTGESSALATVTSVDGEATAQVDAVTGGVDGEAAVLAAVTGVDGSPGGDEGNASVTAAAEAADTI
jgi:adenylate dimethylallyltransferase (cytokinin synthase)